MGLFNFFNETEHKVFDYKPIYYNREDEERRRRFSGVDSQADGERPYVPGSYIKGAFRDGNYQTLRNHNRRIHTVIGIVSLLLVFAVLYFIARFYSML